MPLTTVTKHHILDFLRGETGVRYHGKMDEIEFLRRIFDLSKIKSNDHRCRNFEGDITTHRYSFPDDWDDDWIYTDDRFHLATQSDEIFLRFLCQMLHPLTNRRSAETIRLLGAFNKYLAADGWQLCRAGEISGKPFFEPAPYSRTKAGGIAKVKQLDVVLNAAHISRQLRRIESSVDRDPELAIGTAKEFLESMCRTILAERGQPVIGTPDIPTLNRLTLKELQLLPEHAHQHSKGTELIKRLLSNLATVTQTLAELRGLYGTGHGKDGNAMPIEPRHAKLVVGAAATLGTFLYETHRATKTQVHGAPSLTK